MIAGLKPYPAMKDSGVPWLGDVPEHWEVRKLRNLLNPITARNRPGLPLLSVVREKGVIQRDTTSKDENRNFIPDDLSNYKVVRAGQFAMNKMKAWQGSYGVSQYNGIVSPAYFVFDTYGVEGAFFHAAIRSQTYVPFFAQASDGVRISQWDLSQARMKEIPFSVPPPPEQAAIVLFLDRADRRILRYIRAKQKLIKLLEEQKQAIINRAVTRGLDPNVHLKPSSVEWLGKVPVHWEVFRLKFVAARIVDCLHATPQYSDAGQFPAIRTADIAPGVVRLESVRRIGVEEYDRWTQRLKPAEDDILYSREGERFGIAACVPKGVQLCISQRMMVFSIRREHNSTFVMWQVNSPQVYAQASQDVMGATAPHVNVSTIRNYALVLPTRSEQDAIVAQIEASTGDSARAIATACQEISLLREYRTRLIADVVTGKLDVREASTRLPDEAREPESSDDVEAVEHAEELIDAGEPGDDNVEVET